MTERNSPTPTMRNGRLERLRYRISAAVTPIARAGLLLTLAIILIGSFFGRSLQYLFPGLIVYIPYVGILLIAAAILSALCYGASGAKLRVTPIDRTIRRRLILLTATSCVAIPLASAYLIEFPIERIHLLKFGCLAFFGYFSLPNRSELRRAILAGGGAALVGAGDEVLQHFHPERFFDPKDILLNVSGAAFGLLLAWIASRWKRLYCGEP